MSRTEGINVLRCILKRLRWDDQGGYVGYHGDGEWSFISIGLGQVSPDELNSLFELVDVEPDVIVPLGSCEDCHFSIDGRERGYKQPCLPCTRPYHSHFKPKETKDA